MVNPFQVAQMINNPQKTLSRQLQAAMDRMKEQNPQAYRKAVEMTNGKNESEMRETAMNLAKEQGIDLSKFASRFGIKL